MASVDGRQDFLELMTGAMRGEADESAFGGLVHNGKVKSRLLEAHPPERSSDGVARLLAEKASAAGLKPKLLDEDLWVLLGSDDVFFVDALNPRFWLLHTTSAAETLRRFVRVDLLTDSRLDSAWMPKNQLDQLEGIRHWIRSSFESDVLLPADGQGADGTRRWRVQVEGDAPEELLALASKDPRYAAAAALSAVGSILHDETSEARLIGDYRGAFVASGTSFELVAGALWRTMDRYERFVQTLEDLHQLRITPVEDIGLVVDGDVAVIDLPTEVQDLEHFIGALFNAKEPFRLWAVPREIAAGEWEANAVDLHVGETLRLEITPWWIRVLLDQHTCGNTLARLVTNLQHRFHAQTRIESPLAVA
jgi:hypothetical protein